MSFDPVAARTLVGVRFRPHGRDPATGLDCVGLVAKATGWSGDLPQGYALRNTRLSEWQASLDVVLIRVARPVAMGDVVLMLAGPAQYHLGVWTGTGLLHAHAGLRRVVETPGPIAMPILGIWQLPS